MAGEVVGKDAYIAWVYSAGTVLLDAQYRSFSAGQSVQLVDATNGHDTWKRYKPNLKDGQLSVGLVWLAKGTVVKNALTAGTEGTLIFGPEGTVATCPKMTYPAISQGVKISEPYSDLVEMTCDFQMNGLEVDGTF